MLLNLVSSALSALCLASTAIAGTIRQRENGPSLGHARDLFLRRILADSPEYGNFRNHVPTNHDELKVGIIGGGVAGLYAAILLESLDIDYEILESSKRIGGRVFTHRFDQKAWEASKPGQPNYYDYYVSFPASLVISRLLTDLAGRRGYEISRYGLDEPHNWKRKQLTHSLHKLEAQARGPACEADTVRISSQQHVPSI